MPACVWKQSETSGCRQRLTHDAMSGATLRSPRLQKRPFTRLGRRSSHQRGRAQGDFLLLQEDPSRLIALAMILRSRGCTVLETGNQKEAFDACLEHNGAIQLLRADFELCRHQGPQVAMRLLELSPEMQVLFVLDSPPESVLDKGSLPGGCKFLSKPFGADALINAVETLLRLPRIRTATQRKPDHREETTSVRSLRRRHAST